MSKPPEADGKKARPPPPLPPLPQAGRLAAQRSPPNRMAWILSVESLKKISAPSLARARRHALPAGTQRLSAHWPRQEHMPEFRVAQE